MLPPPKFAADPTEQKEFETALAAFRPAEQQYEKAIYELQAALQARRYQVLCEGQLLAQYIHQWVTASGLLWDLSELGAVTLDVYVEVNVGANRCGVEPGEPATPVGDIVSDPDRPRVIVADIDSGINPYHAYYYAGSEIYPDAAPSSVTQEVLDAFGVKPENVVELTPGTLSSSCEST